MNTMPMVGTKVKIIGRIANSFYKSFDNFEERNEFIVIGPGRIASNGEILVNVQSTKGFMCGQILQFFKNELEKI